MRLKVTKAVITILTLMALSTNLFIVDLMGDEDHPPIIYATSQEAR